MFLYVCLYECAYVYMHMSVAAHRGQKRAAHSLALDLVAVVSSLIEMTLRTFGRAARVLKSRAIALASLPHFICDSSSYKLCFFLEYFVTVHNILYFFIIKIRFVFRLKNRKEVDALIVPRSSFRNILSL